MKCDFCEYEWIAVSPVEAQELECPQCGKMTTVYPATATAEAAGMGCGAETKERQMNTKECPFCAYNETRIEASMAKGGDHYEYRVMCLNCGAHGPNDMSEKRAAKSWNMRRKVHPSVQVDADANTYTNTDADVYDDLRNATPEELLKAAQWFYRQGAEPPGRLWDTYLLRLGWQLARPDGWIHCAPWWLRESREEKEK